MSVRYSLPRSVALPRMQYFGTLVKERSKAAECFLVNNICACLVPNSFKSEKSVIAPFLTSFLNYDMYLSPISYLNYVSGCLMQAGFPEIQVTNTGICSFLSFVNGRNFIHFLKN